MADVNKTVQITYSANTGPLQRGIRQIPHVTKTEMQSAIRSVDKQLKKAEKSADRTAKKMRTSFKNAAKGIGMVGSGLAVAGAGVISFSQRLADLTNDLVDTSTKTGIAVDTLAALRLAAEGSGLAFEQFIGPLQRLQAHMVDASNGVKISTELFDAMGVQVTDTNGNLKDADLVFREMMTNLGNMENPLRRNALLMDAFGKSGAMFAQSGVVGNLEEFVNLTNTLGSHAMPNAIEQAADFQRAMADLSLVGEGALQTILTTMTGTNGMTDAIDSITTGIIYLEAIFKANFAAMSMPVILLQRDLVTLSTFLTEGLDAGVRAFKVGNEMLEDEFNTMVNSFDEATAKIEALKEARAKIRGDDTTDTETGQKTANTAAESAKKEAAAIAKVTEARRTDLELIKEIERANKQLRMTQVDLIDDTRTEVDRSRKAHSDRLNQYDEEIAALNRRYTEERDAIVELYNSKQITEEEGMARLLAMETEVLDAVQAANFAKASSYRRMQREIDALGEEAKQKEIERQQEIAAAFGDSMISAGSTIMDSMTTIQENELKRLEEQLSGSLDVIDERVEKGLMTEKEAAKQRELVESSHEQSIREQQMKIYNMKKSTAIAQILIDAAAAAARAFADYPFPASLGIAALAGAGATAQIKAVESTPAPYFDMGGMIGNNDGRRPDETYIRALEGEAILDRATVQSLGGESGIRALQNGKGAGEVVVVQPFKHFDRFMKTQNRKRQKRTGRGSY
jgi:hypothetical protein